MIYLLHFFHYYQLKYLPYHYKVMTVSHSHIYYHLLTLIAFDRVIEKVDYAAVAVVRSSHLMVVDTWVQTCKEQQ